MSDNKWTESLWLQTFVDTEDGERLADRPVVISFVDGEVVGAKVGRRELTADEAKFFVELIT